MRRKERNEMTYPNGYRNHSRQRRRRMPLARCQAVADTRKIIEMKFDLHHKLHKKFKKRTEIWTIYFQKKFKP